jgi:hypothetical protein
LIRGLIVVLLLASSLLVVAERTATSKVTWRERRGAPLAFATFAAYRGPCGTPPGFCEARRLAAWSPAALLLDGLGLYVVVCGVGFMWARMGRSTA